MKIVIFGLAITSSWGNGHATLWRGLCRALAGRGHDIVFFERDTTYYAEHRDLPDPAFAKVVLYPDWDRVEMQARSELNDADVGMVTSYCPDGIVATEIVLSSRAAIRVFYDMDTPITLERLSRGEALSYIGPRGLRDFDLVLSYTGGEALTHLRELLGARRAEPLYGSVDPDVHRPVPAQERFAADLSYLGTFAQERQEALEEFFIEPARRRPHRKFLIGGALYPQAFPWADNIHFVHHVQPSEHPEFFSSSRLTLNVTRRAMAEMGYCPSGRLFEATACGVPVLSDSWPGLEEFFRPGKEILVTSSAEGSLQALDLAEAERQRIARAGRERTLAEHTAERRAREFEGFLSAAPVTQRADFAQPSAEVSTLR
jgi:spore maturation protein CgeB